jgi:uncharacterized membrane protein YeaQ/YmgE (transglycosylase-associated protein family)
LSDAGTRLGRIDGAPADYAAVLAGQRYFSHRPLLTVRRVVGTGRGRPAIITTRRSRHLKECNMGLILWLIVGGIVGWLASMIMKTDGQQGIILNVVVGIVGAFIGGWLISPLVGMGTINSGISIGSIVVSLIGAIILLAIINLFRRGRAR